jgi:hypothetical protein
VADQRNIRPPNHEVHNGHARIWAVPAKNGSAPDTTVPFPSPAGPASYADEARYCPMLAVDIKAFNDRQRGEDVLPVLREAMYGMLTRAASSSALSWTACHREDRGDGVLVIAPPGTPETALIDPFVDHLRAGLRRHNKLHSDVATIRLRMSVHAGRVSFDQNGVSGHAVNHLFRMLEAPAFKRAFTGSGTDFALVTSDVLFEDVISQGPGLIDPGMYAPINIRSKETRARAWLYLPPVRHPFLHTVSGPAQPLKAKEPSMRRPARPKGAAVPRPRATQDTDSATADVIPNRTWPDVNGAVPRLARLTGVLASSAWHSQGRTRLHPGNRAHHLNRGKRASWGVAG